MRPRVIVFQYSQGSLFCPILAGQAAPILLQASCMRATTRVHETCEIFCVATARTHALVRPYALSTATTFSILVSYTTLAS